MKFSRFWSRDWGPALKRSARVSIAVAALVFTVGSILAQGAYDLGRLTRMALEDRNDQLARAWVHALGVAPVRPVSVQAPAAVAAPVAPPPPKPPRKRKAAAVVSTTAKAKPRPARPARRRKPSAKVVEVACG